MNLLFLMGLSKYGRGRWSKIARHYLHNKTPQQVQSYANRFFSHLPPPPSSSDQHTFTTLEEETHPHHQHTLPPEMSQLRKRSCFFRRRKSIMNSLLLEKPILLSPTRR
ncbi:hypothetical protein Ahy_B05g076249 [Arachis hypogaea]|uniref:Uncharacterized protein n=1 Tax=Arachis hypogaea TaxID=3818 RepID=A0A444Z2U8_ARAHY|nr:hypothetical protein Ahy_B05g076249 [Arachis hypogaea]